MNIKIIVKNKRKINLEEVIWTKQANFLTMNKNQKKKLFK